ncbi:MAG: hypothetical protein PHP32_01825 [Candidatus Izemoplasmatales bacterium]|nr:hypothetical protein [Candidatus Izemoplasmatales bacterium]
MKSYLFLFRWLEYHRNVIRKAMMFLGFGFLLWSMLFFFQSKISLIPDEMQFHDEGFVVASLLEDLSEENSEVRLLELEISLAKYQFLLDSGTHENNYYDPEQASSFFAVGWLSGWMSWMGKGVLVLALVMAFLFPASQLGGAFEQGQWRMMVLASKNRRQVIVPRVLVSILFPVVLLLFFDAIAFFLGLLSTPVWFLTTNGTTFYALSGTSLFLSKVLADTVLVLSVSALTTFLTIMFQQSVTSIAITFLLFAISLFLVQWGHLNEGTYFEQVLQIQDGYRIPLFGLETVSQTGWTLTFLWTVLAHLGAIILFGSLSVIRFRRMDIA